MKNVKLFFGLVTAVILFNISCSTEDLTDKPVNLSYLQDGVSYDGSSNARYYLNLNDKYTISAKINDSITFLIEIPELAVGDWSTEENGEDVSITVMFSNDETSDIYTSDSDSLSFCNVSVSSYDKGTSMIEGSFSGKLGELWNTVLQNDEYINITSGDFAVKND